MKHLRKFPNAETRDEVLSNVTHNVLSYTRGEGILITNTNITLKFYSGDGNITVEHFENPDEQYTIAYDTETTLRNILTGLGITPGAWGAFMEYEIDDDRVYFSDSVDMYQLIPTSGILPGSTLYFAPNLV